MSREKLKNLLKLQKILYGTDGLYLEEDQPILVKSGNNTIDKKNLLLKLKTEVEKCKKCQLWKTRVNTVFGEGDENTDLMFIGEGPGYEEDKQGRPFVGRAGELLTKMIVEAKLSREKVYITNIVKCHPVIKPDPYIRNNDRPPTEEEIKCCLPYLKKQIEIISPRIICCLGATAVKVLTGIQAPIYELRSKEFTYQDNPEIKIIPTYHPAALLRNPALESLVQKDIHYIAKLLHKC